MEMAAKGITRFGEELEEFDPILFLCVLENFGEFGGKSG
jgi:hypothetical protein